VGAQQGANAQMEQKETYDFARSEIGTSPGGGVSGTTVVTLSPDTVCEFGGGVVSVANEVVCLRLVVLGLVRRPEVLHWTGGDRVGGRGVGIGGRVRLGVSRAVVVWRRRLVVETVSLGGGVSCLHYDLIWVGRRGVKVPLLLLGRGLERRGERGEGRDRGGRTWGDGGDLEERSVANVGGGFWN
jgi:hypothetical protein